MATVISAGTTTGTGFGVTPDASGNLAFQTQAGANTITVPNTTGTLATTSQLTRFKSRIINGDMRISQRNGSSSATIGAAVTYTLDRWYGYGQQASKFTIQQNAGSVTPPVGFINYLGATSLSAYSVLTGDEFDIAQPIEGLNVADLGWGTAYAKTVTLSFWVRSSLTGTFGGALNNYNSSRSYPFSYTISSANTWTQINLTVAGDTSGTWLTTNGIGLLVNFSLGAGATKSGTVNTWASANYTQPTGSVSVVGTSGATFYITGVQLEVGSIATGFEYVDYTTKLSMCQRYYISTGTGNAMVSNGANDYVCANFPTTMRTAPTTTTTASSTFDSSSIYGFIAKFTGLTGSGYTASAEL